MAAANRANRDDVSRRVAATREGGEPDQENRAQNVRNSRPRPMREGSFRNNLFGLWCMCIWRY